MNGKENKVAVIVVTYNPDLNVLNHLLDELYLRNDIYVSDNGSKNFKDILALCRNFDSVYLINNKDNLGIGTAQNKAIKVIQSKGLYDFIFFLDQDSFVKSKVLNKLVEEYVSLTRENKKVGSISVIEFSPENDREHYESVNQTISSGMLIPNKVLKEVGNMYEELFIDWIDYEWCWRAKKAGYLIIRDNNCFFEHEIGTNERVLGKIPPAPFRLYYVFRNIHILMKTGKTLEKNNLHLKYGLFKQIIFNVVFCPNRIKRAKYIIWGIKDGRKNILGRNKDL